MNQSLCHLRYHYLPILEKVLYGLFPNVELLGGQLSDHGFFYDFILDGVKFDDAFVAIIEGRLKEILHEGVEVSFVEMMHDVAVNFLMHKKQKSKAILLEEGYSPGLLSFLRVDDFLEPIPEEIEPLPSKELKHFELYSVTCLSEGGVVRIEGSAFLSSKDLKSFRKKRKHFVGFDHLTLAREMKLYAFDSCYGRGVWMSKGVSLLNIFFDFWRKLCSQEGYQLIQTGSSSEREFYRQLKFTEEELFTPECPGVSEILCFNDELEPLECQGMWRVNNYLTDRSCRLVDWNDMQSVLISSLQSIMKTVNILCSDCCWVLCTPTTGSFTQKKRERKFLVELQKALEACHIPFKNEYVEDKEIKEPRVSCMIPDGLGKYWSGPFVSVRSFGNKEDSQTVVCCSLFGSFERMTASILERFRGNLPLSIAPEQVRLVSMPSQSVHTKMAFERLSHEGFRVGVDRADRRLAEKVHSAEKEKVPYIAVIGEVEAKKNMLTLRKNERNNKQRNVTINDLLDELHQENSEMSPFAF